MTRAIVTGGCGFIGYNLCKFLSKDIADEWNVVVIDDISTGSKSNIIDNKNFQYYFESLSNIRLLDKVIKSHNPEVIFHLAAVPRVSYSVLHPLETYKSNVLCGINLLDSIRRNKIHCRVINSSSSSVYGGMNGNCLYENLDCCPRSPYAMQKYHFEQICALYCLLYDMDIVSLRYFNCFGPFSRYGGAYSTVLSAWMYSLFVDNSIVPYLEGNGKQSRDFCHVNNVVYANVLAASNDRERFLGDAYNIAHGESWTLLQCKEIIEDISGQKIELDMRPERIGDVRHTLADISKAKIELKYTPKTNFRDQVREMCDWYKNDYLK